jgi:hypothetical protein
MHDGGNAAEGLGALQEYPQYLESIKSVREVFLRLYCTILDLAQMHDGGYVAGDLEPLQEYSGHFELGDSTQNSMRYTQIPERSILETVLHCMQDACI